MKPLQYFSALSILGLLAASTGGTRIQAAEPIKILLVAGGCCHDYAEQSQLLKSGIESRINAKVTVEYNPDTSTKALFKSYGEEGWADHYDVVLHDECSASVTDKTYVKRILDAHRKGTPAVNLHCAMHSYRWGDFKEPVAPGGENAGWYEMLGIQSTAHGPQAPIAIVYQDKTHPISKGLADWTTINEELYNNVQVFDSAHVLAKGTQIQKPGKKKGKKADPDAEAKEVTTVVTWTNEYGPNKTRIFSTTIGHNTETVLDDRYLDLVTRGLLWVTKHIDDNGAPADGYGL